MSVFQIPKGVCKRMMDAIASFWWGDDEESNKMHWYAWWKMCYPKSEGGMGFRDFHSFNLAMLAKQVWRLIKEPDSLCAKVLRAKYYPDGNIFRAGPKAGSSFTWQSILAGLTTFKRGFIWRVGNGEKINIWSDPWVPASADFKVISPRRGTVLTKVNDLIDPYTGAWDEVLLAELFNPVDVNRILQIPLHNQGFEDFVAWGHTSHGRYTVKSGYYIQWKHHFGARASQLTLPGTSTSNPVWKALWKLKIPGKVKIFSWRALHGILPLKCILANRHIGESAECPVCALDAEDVRHLLFTCQVAKDMWAHLELSDVIVDAIQVDRSGSAVLEHILRMPSTAMPGMQSVQLKEVIMVTCWYLWWLRRRRTHNEDIPPLHKCKFSILAIVANSALENKSLQVDSTTRWQRPLPRQVKLNVDASYHADVGTGAVGAVIRDYEGKFIAASTKFIPHVLSATAAEALAMKEGLKLAVFLGCNNVIAESDSSEVIEACSGEEAWWNDSAATYADCLDVAMTIGTVTFSHCLREANKVAHSLARFSFSNKSDCNWVDEPPSIIMDELLNDVMVL
jgi:ribonuclease HI